MTLAETLINQRSNETISFSYNPEEWSMVIRYERSDGDN